MTRKVQNCEYFKSHEFISLFLKVILLINIVETVSSKILEDLSRN